MLIPLLHHPFTPLTLKSLSNLRHNSIPLLRISILFRTYTSSLAPFPENASSLKLRSHTRWSPTEQQLILKAVELYGRRWQKIATEVFYGEKTSKACQHQYERLKGLRRTSFTPEEEESLRKAVESLKDSTTICWETVASLVSSGQISAKACQQRWEKIKNSSPEPIQRCPWTSSETDRLIQLYSEHSKNADSFTIPPKTSLESWFPDRSFSSIRNKLLTILTKQGQSYSSTKSPQQNHSENCSQKNWTPDEDSKLLQGVAEWGCLWTTLSKEIFNNTKSPVQLIRRYQRLQLHQQTQFNFRPEEDHQLMLAFKEIGPHWSKIHKKYFPYRTSMVLKKRMDVLSRPQENKNYRDWSHRELKWLVSLSGEKPGDWVSVSQNMITGGYVRSPLSCAERFWDWEVNKKEIEEIKFSKEEDKALLNAVSQYKNDWQKIKATLPKKDWSYQRLEERYIELWQESIKLRGQCKEESSYSRWTTFMDTMLLIGYARKMIPAHISEMMLRIKSPFQISNRSQYLLQTCPMLSSSFTPEDDKRLLESVQQYGQKWSYLASQNFPGISKTWLRERYFRLVKAMEGTPLKKGVWSEEEKTLLLKGLEKFGRDLEKLSEFLSFSRTPAQISKYLFRNQGSLHFPYHLNPITKRFFTPEEDHLLQQAIKEVGPKWRIISEKYFKQSRSPPSLLIRSKRLERIKNTAKKV